MSKRTRFIQSILRAAQEEAVELPWQRAKRQAEQGTEAAPVDALRASA